ncbi:hypothetical protein YN1_3180 [Nanoarchaeota archaeon]
MKIIVASDIHNDFDMIYRIIDIYQKIGADYIILLGDIGDYGEIKKNLIKKLVEKINPNKIIILPGNHETYEQIKELKYLYNVKDLHRKYFIKDNIVIAGFGGADVPLFMVDEDDLKKFLYSIEDKGKYIILFTHIPPKGSLTSLNISGSESLRNFIEKERKVILNVHGHMHETGGLEDIINNAKIVNVARTIKIIEISNKKTYIKDFY